MYLARFDVSGGEWIQAAVLIEPASAATADRVAAMWDLVAAQLSVAARIAQATVAYRISVDTTRRVRQTVTVTAPADHERDVREVVARLTRVERMQGGALSLASARKERDRWMESLGAFRCCATADSFSVARIPLACNFRLSDTLDELLTDACITGHALAYQIHVRAAGVRPDWVREARKSMLALHDLPGICSGLIELQNQLARGLGHAGAFCEEYLAVDTATAARSIEQLLADRFRARYGPLGFPPAAFRFEGEGYQNQLVMGIHTHDLDPLDPVALCSVAEPPAGRDRLLAWQPSARLRALFMRPQEVGQRDPSDEGAGRAALDADATLPRPYDGSGPAVFVSYKRADIARVSRIIRLLQEIGLRVWYDRGIPGGSEWDEEIEERLRHAPFVVVCTSQAAVASKYVRREVKFADSLDVPILPVLLEEVTLAHGMGMLLTQYQMLDARVGNFVEALRRAVAHLHVPLRE
jgi:hypothetical protein